MRLVNAGQVEVRKNVLFLLGQNPILYSSSRFDMLVLDYLLVLTYSLVLAIGLLSVP